MFSSFILAKVVGLFCIYAILVLLFHDFLQPVPILMALALRGALLALAVSDNSLSMPADHIYQDCFEAGLWSGANRPLLYESLA